MIGADASEGRLGGYSGPGIKNVSILDGIREALGGKATVRFVAGPGRITRELAVVPSENLHARTGGQPMRGLRGEYFDNNRLEGDPRVTRVGKILRRYSIDELPQVLNVLRGEMSLVGPRPLPLRDYVQLEDWHRKRYLVLPGMTGLWQVSGRIDLSFDDLVRLDFYYLENWSIWLDISILAKTLPAVAARRGAY